MMRRAMLLSFFLASVCLGQTAVMRIIPSETVILREPSAISTAPDGSLIISDTGHNRVLSVGKQGKLLFEVGSMGSGPGEFMWPKDIAAESGIVLWVADFGNRRVSKLSRQFEMKGSLIVMDQAKGSAEQIEKIAVSPQGDVYLYAEDSGQLLRYDPLFVLQGSLGATLGESFIPRIRQLVYVAGKGIVWHSRGDKYLSFSDPLLIQAGRLPTLLDNLDKYVFAASGAKLYAGAVEGIFLISMEGEPAQELLSQQELKEAGIRSVDDIAVTNDGTIYILNSRSGSVYSAILQNR
ncbi:hypothetical protein KKC97_03575 [bacterium]|nr:hypothetical protein [bacterium]